MRAPLALLVLSLCAPLRVGGLTWPHDSGQGSSNKLQSDAAAVDEAYLEARADAQMIADAEDGARAKAEMTTRTAIKATFDNGWAELEAQVTHGAVQVAQAAQAAQVAQAEQVAQVAQATQAAQAALAARAGRIDLERTTLKLQFKQKAVGDTATKVHPAERNLAHYQYTRHLLSPEQSGDGVCLDGSPPGFYYSPAPAGSKHNNSWLLFLSGGAWCTDKDACLVRSKTELGTSTVWGKTLPKSAMKSWLSSDPKLSPFHDYHKAVLMYCDGASFSGHVDAPVQVGKDTIYLRGRLVLTALIRALGRLGLDSAEQVLLSGGSAGGLAAILQGNRVRAMLPRVEKFKVVSFAGWFRTDTGACRDAAQCPWLKAMPKAYALHQMRSSDADSQVESACLREHGWRCLHASSAAQRVESPLFLVQSSLDSWQLANIWRGSTLSNGTIDKGSCIGSIYGSECRTEEIRDLNGESCSPLQRTTSRLPTLRC